MSCVAIITRKDHGALLQQPEAANVWSSAATVIYTLVRPYLQLDCVKSAATTAHHTADVPQLRSFHLQAAGRPATSVQWGAWGGGGMAQRVPGFVARMERQGLGLLQPEAGLAVLASVLGAAVSPLHTSAPLQPVITGESYCRNLCIEERQYSALYPLPCLQQGFLYCHAENTFIFLTHGCSLCVYPAAKQYLNVKLRRISVFCNQQK